MRKRFVVNMVFYGFVKIHKKVSKNLWYVNKVKISVTILLTKLTMRDTILTVRKGVSNVRLKLKGLIIEKYGSVTNYANSVGITRQAVTKYLRGEQMTSKSMLFIGKSLGIKQRDYGVFFFPELSEKSEES